MSLRVNEGYDYQLVNGTPPDEYICLLCHLLARDAHQANCCGRIFCRNCLESRRNRSSGYTCASCYSPLAGKYFKDTKTDYDICHLQIYCTNKEKGCNWQGNIKDIDIHIPKCPNQVVTCDKCKQIMQGDQLESHVKDKCVLRYYKCVYCQIVGKYNFITGRHQEVCPDVVLPCTNEGCQQNIKRCNMELHRQTCPKEIVKCPYYDIGCHTEMKREDIDQHEENNTKIHLKKALEKIKEKIKEKTCPISIKLTEFSKRKGLQNHWYSSGFYTSAGGYKIHLVIFAKGCGDNVGDSEGTHISCFINLMPGEYDDTLEWPFQGEVTVQLLNQLEDKNHLKRTILFNDNTPDECKNRKNEVDNEGWGKGQFIPHTDLGHNSSTNTQYLMNDTLYFRVSVNVHSKTKPWLL